MRILIAGDFCPRYRVAEAFVCEDYASVLSEVRDLTSQVDYAIVNFECPVVLGDAKPIDKMGPNLRCGKEGVAAVKYAGFNCVTLANNHILDYGREGVCDTLATFDEYEIDHVGGGVDLNEASRVFYKDIAGQKLAIVNCCECEFSIATEFTAGANPLSPVQQYYAIKEAHDNADFVLVIVHGGHEHFRLPSPRMVETYRFFIDAGADAVVNHHQHCYSGYELYKGKPVFYGLGNFCFDNSEKRSGIWTEGYAVDIDFNCKIPSFLLHPVRQCDDNPKVELLAKDSYDNKIDRLNEIIVSPARLSDKVNQYYACCVSGYSNIFEPCNNRIYLGAKRRGWLPSFISKDRKLKACDFVLCEAHRDILKYWFENI